MNFGVGILLAVIGYFIVRAVWRIYRAVGVDRPDRGKKPMQQTYRDEFGEEQEVEDARWRDLP